MAVTGFEPTLAQANRLMGLQVTRYSREANGQNKMENIDMMAFLILELSLILYTKKAATNLSDNDTLQYNFAQ